MFRNLFAGQRKLGQTKLGHLSLFIVDELHNTIIILDKALTNPMLLIHPAKQIHSNHDEGSWQVKHSPALPDHPLCEVHPPVQGQSQVEWKTSSLLS